MTIEEIIHQYGSYIYHFAFRLTANSIEAEDITQTTFIYAWQGLTQLRDEKAIKKWLRIICYNEFKQLLKKKNKIYIDRYETIDDLENDAQYCKDLLPSPIEEAKMKEEVINMRNGCFLAMTKKLTLHQRVAFSLVDMFGLKIDEVAEILDMTPKAVKGLLYRARKNLDIFFKNHCYFLDVNNSCRCKAWIEFLQDRNRFQKKMKETQAIFNNHKQHYVYDEQTRQKVLNYYANLPFSCPNDDWFENIIKIIQKKA